MFLSRNKKNNLYPYKTKFYYIKVGFKGIITIQACFRDEWTNNEKIGHPARLSVHPTKRRIEKVETRKCIERLGLWLIC